MANAVELAVKVTASTTDATSGLEAVGDSARSMASEVDKAATKADGASRKLDSLGSAAEGVDDKMGRTTGSLGALSSGFELVGAEKYAAGLQSAALATDFLSGAGQALMLITEGEALANIQATATTYAKVAAEKAAAAAAKATAAAQWLLNAAMAANPIGLVVIAVIALVAGFVLLYNKSDRFRALMNTIWAGIQSAVSATGGVLKTVLGAAILVITTYIKAWWTAASTAFSAAQTAIGLVKDAFDKVKDVVGTVADKLDDIEVPDGVVDAIDAIKDAIDDVIDAVESLIGWLGKIKIPKPPSWLPGVGKSSTPAAVSVASAAGRGARTTATAPGVGATAYGAGTVVVNFNNLVTDPYATANAIRRVLTRRDLIVGAR
jgi:phage-related protein